MSLAERLSRLLVPWLLRERRAVLRWAAVTTLASTVFAVRLYADLRSGIEELLPDTAPSVVAARTLGSKLRSFSRLSIVLECEDGEALARFADRLVPRLKRLPQSLVASVDDRTDEQDEFLRRFGALYLPLWRLEALRDQLRARVAWEKGRANPLLVSLEDDSAAQRPPPVALPPEASAALRLRSGRWQTPDGRLLVIVLTPPDSSTDAGRNAELLGAVQAEVAALRVGLRGPPMRIGYTGEVAELVEEQAALVADLASSTVVVLLLVVGALWLYFRSWALLSAIFLALAAGCAACFAASYFLVGHLNANTAFLGSIVVGNGINAGIIYVARYLEERRVHAVDEALRRAWSCTLPATFVASFGAALAYLSLAATDFRGFSQFGVIGAVGMSCCWVSAYLLLPPLLAAWEASRPLALRPVAHPARSPFALLGALVQARPRALVLASALGLAGAVLAVARHQGPLLETDTSRLRAKASLERGAQHWSRKADQIFHAYLNPVVLRAETPAGLERVLAALQRRRAALGRDGADPLGEVRGLASLVPPESEQLPKVAVLEELRGLLGDGLLASLPPELRAQASSLRPPAGLRPVRFEDLPSQLRRGLTERDGTIGTIALAYPRKVEQLDLREAEALKDLVRGAVADAGGRAQALNPLFLLSDIDAAIWRDGPRATGVALALVCLLVLVVVRRAAASAAVLGTLLLGLAGLLGLAAAGGVRVNFLNFVVLPITFGIGVDYAINVVQRYREEGPGSVSRVVRETGAAVALCSATTVIGYGSLAVADNQALAGFGLLAALGEVTCLTAAVLCLPACLVLRERAGPPLPVDPSMAPGV